MDVDWYMVVISRRRYGKVQLNESEICRERTKKPEPPSIHHMLSLSLAYSCVWFSCMSSVTVLLVQSYCMFHYTNIRSSYYCSSAFEKIFQIAFYIYFFCFVFGFICVVAWNIHTTTFTTAVAVSSSFSFAPSPSPFCTQTIQSHRKLREVHARSSFTNNNKCNTHPYRYVRAVSLLRTWLVRDEKATH